MASESFISDGGGVVNRIQGMNHLHPTAAPCPLQTVKIQCMTRPCLSISLFEELAFFNVSALFM